ncbi:ligand-binding sensor domain-containing protein [Colwellia piezophila]|uniref:ligand-binding sensor domain-containing protein n=1 Tax=Colwellia piezophila TaxID=211668 RepID=UPI00036660BD|nr:hypothetical protein [Colwellia piezophila]
MTTSLTSHASHSTSVNSTSVNSFSNIAKILQDKRGFVWLAGQEGLIRADGKQSINFSLNNQEWPLPYSWIQDIALIDDKLLLATETHGLWLFDTRNGGVEKLPIKTHIQSHYRAVFFKGHYYIYSPYKLYRFNPITKITEILHHNIVISKLLHSNEQLYIVTSDGLFQLQDEQLLSVLPHSITAITVLSNAVIAITADKIYRLTDDGQLTSIAHNERIYGLTKTFAGDNFITVSSTGKVTQYHGLTLTTLPHHYGIAKDVRLKAVFQDSSGVLWLASSHGVEQLSESFIKNHDVDFKLAVNANEITLFENEIIIGSYGAGLQNFLTPVFKESVNNNFSKKGLKIFDVLAVNKQLYTASFDGIWRFDKTTQQVTKLHILANQLILKLEHKNNLLYIGTNYDGLYIYDLASKKITKQISVEHGLISTEILDVLPLDNGQLWIANNNNISLYQPSSNSVITLDTPNKSKVASFVLADNKVFASTLGDGILVFNLQGDLLAQIFKGHSFTEMLVEGSDIWVSGQPGLYRLSPTTHQLTLIENTQQYTFVSSLLVKDNTLYAIHYSGILAITLIKQKQFNPNVLISKTTISGRPYLLNKTIEIDSGNDVITLDLASLDYRPGLAKKYQYRINNNNWQQISNNQLTLTGLAAGNYHVEIMATNSLGQWSNIKAFTEIHVAYPWYWSLQLRIFYGVTLFFTVLIIAWLLFLRTKSIKHIHTLLKNDMRNSGKLMKVIQRNLQLVSTSLESNDIVQSKQLIQQSILALEESSNAQEPDNLAGKTLSIAVPFLADYVFNKYQVTLHTNIDEELDKLNYELRADVYKVIFEALISAIFKSNVANFDLTLQEVKGKLWLTISADNDSFSQLSSKVSFDLASYTIRQITYKHQASLNTFTNDDKGSQLVISFPLMALT